MPVVTVIMSTDILGEDSGSDDYLPSDKDVDSEDGEVEDWDSDADAELAAVCIFCTHSAAVPGVVAHMLAEHKFDINTTVAAGTRAAVHPSR